MEPSVASAVMLPFSAMYSPPTIHVPFAMIASTEACSSSVRAEPATTVRPSSSPSVLTTETVLGARMLEAMMSPFAVMSMFSPSKLEAMMMPPAVTFISLSVLKELPEIVFFALTMTDCWFIAVSLPFSDRTVVLMMSSAVMLTL